MGLFGAARGKKAPTLPKTYPTYPIMIKLDKITPYRKKTQKINKSHYTPLEFC